MVKADDKVVFNKDDKPENFTYFEEVMTSVELLKEQLDEIAAILQENNITRTKEVEASYFDVDELYERLSNK